MMCKMGENDAYEMRSKVSVISNVDKRMQAQSPSISVSRYN